MTLSQLITKDDIIPELKAQDRWGAIRELSERLFEQAGFDPAARPTLLGRLHDRENRQSTGIGAGVGIPHAQVPGLAQVFAIMGRSVGGLEFEAVDDELVNLVVLFLVPEDQPHLRLEILSAIGKTLVQPKFRDQLLRAVSVDEMHSVLTGRPKH
jgi:nitrogen PTS system EIIA component